MTSVTAPKRDRLYFLDSLRGFAAVYVVFFHTLVAPQPNPALSNHVAFQLVHFGGTGVFLFFVISGFSLSLTMPRHGGSSYPVLSYAISRLFRVAPLFYVLLLFFVLLGFLGLGAAVRPYDLLLNVSFLFNLAPDKQEGIVWASWTIGVEMLFYISFPWVYKRSVLAQILLMLLSLIIFAFIFTYLPSNYIYFLFLGYFPIFIIGIWGFGVFRFLTVRGSNGVLTLAFSLVGIAILVGCILPSHAEKDIYLRSPIALGYALILVGAGLSRLSILSWSVCVFYGRISYSLYLVHPIAIFSLRKWFTFVESHTSGDLIYWCDAFSVLIVSTLIAWLLYIAIEQPGIRLGNRVMARLSDYLATKPRNPHLTS